MSVIDCDVHCAPASIEALLPYLDEYWHGYLDRANLQLHGLASSYPPGAPTSGSSVPHSYEELRERFLDAEGGPRHAVLNCLTPMEAHRNPYYAAALAGAVNDWVRDEFLERDERLRGAIAVPVEDPADAVAEIERRAGDPRFAHVLLPVRSDRPWGHKVNHPIFEEAARHGRPVALHAWGRPASAPTPSGFATTYLEDYLANQQIAQAQLINLVLEGVFDRVPEARVLLLECGFTWLPSLLWRFDKDWKGVWRETPWVKRRPSEYVAEHIRLSTAPAFLPPEEEELRQMLEMMDVPGLLVHAGDFPHDHDDSIGALLALLGEEERAAVLGGNAATLYGLPVTA